MSEGDLQFEAALHRTFHYRLVISEALISRKSKNVIAFFALLTLSVLFFRR